MTSVTRHVQHHFYAFHGLQALTTGYAIGTWGAAQGVVYNQKGVRQLRD